MFEIPEELIMEDMHDDECKDYGEDIRQPVRT